MVSVRQKNPLRRRVLREVRGEFGKYLVIFLMLTLTIGFVSGFLVATGSLLQAYDDSFTVYNMEDGHFTTAKQLNPAQRKAVQALGVTVYDLCYEEQPLENDRTMRMFANRTEVNQVCLMEGDMPTAAGEIAIDRMYADNNDLSVGDTLISESGDRSWTITGLVALSDYSAVFQNNSDSMFDSLQFGVGIVTEEEFALLDDNWLNYCYAWQYDTAPADEAEEKQLSEDFCKALVNEVSLKSFVPRYQNQAIKFTGDDMGGDRAMWIALLYIIIAIMAFVFGITISNTIAKEANVIGTLRASGYTRGELIRHYMAPPLLVTLVSAIIGNLLGYTALKGICAGMYYGSYSLPTYVTVWNGEAFVLTTVVPFLLMMAITFFVLWRKLSLSPLKFLRRDLSRRKQKRAAHLSDRIPFFSRFRLRVIFQNMGSYVVLLVGILFANLLLMFGLMFPPLLSHYQADLTDHMLVNYQYMLQVPLELTREDHKLEGLIAGLRFQSEVDTDNPDAEPFSAYSLRTLGEIGLSEEVLFYGVEPDSRYISVTPGGVSISKSYADKFNLSPGDSITLKEEYEDTTYTFTVTSVYDYEGAVCVFMDRDTLNQTFNLGSGYFCGYFSDTEITDIDPQYIGTVIDLTALTKVTRQLTASMGNMMVLMDGFAVVIFLVIIYLLSKLIIEKNAQSISMTKILGYTNGEIGRLYILSTSVVVVLLLLLSLPVETWLMDYLFRVIMVSSFSGWIPVYFDPAIYWKMMALGVGAYAVVAALELRRIRRVPMDAALKNVE